MSWYFYHKPYVSVAGRKQKAKRIFNKLKKKNPSIAPVVVEGIKLAKSFWGISWNTNLESYEDFEYRLDRGKTYLRHGAVLDLQIKEGKVFALVQGSRSNPYKVDITIKPVSKKLLKEITKVSSQHLDDMDDLLSGVFPQKLAKVFLKKGAGLFPSHHEINFECSCPDWASLCKHVAATLYGVGVRLDKKPEMFFTLRNVEVESLLKKATRQKAREIMQKGRKNFLSLPLPIIQKSDAELSKLFGVEIQTAQKRKSSKRLQKAPHNL